MPIKKSQFDFLILLCYNNYNEKYILFTDRPQTAGHPIGWATLIISSLLDFIYSDGKRAHHIKHLKLLHAKGILLGCNNLRENY